MMTREEMRRKVLSLIEEYDAENELGTDDIDIQAKYRFVENQVMYELARYKKIAKYVEMDVDEGDLITFEDIEASCGYAVYQVNKVGGVKNEPKAAGTVYKMLESGTAEIECFVYPERIKENTADNYEYELSQDALEVMPYGIAADLLKSDVSSEYGKVYAERYETMKQLLDTRYTTGSVYIEGGVLI